MKVLVTGGAGFIGRWVVRALLARGDHVVALDDFSNGRRENVAEFAAEQQFSLVKGDVSDPRAIADVVRRRFDLCFHLAAMIEVQRSIDDPLRAFEVNLRGAHHVLEASRKLHARLVLVSTCMVYDTATPRGSIGEDHPVKPASPYAATKLASEHLALSYHRAYGLPVTVLRPFNVYGPYQKTNQEGGVVAVFAQRALKGKPIQVFGDGGQTRDFMYVDDCVDLILRAGSSEAAVGGTFNGGSGMDVSIGELARIVGGSNIRVEHVQHPHPESEIRKLRCNAAKAARVLGWKPRISLEDGIGRLKDWLEE